MIFIDNSPFLSHYGVLGMKWGVRKDGMPQGYQGSGKGRRRKASKDNDYPMTKKELKRSIKNAKRTYRKKTGEWMTTGKNVAKLDREVEEVKSKDEKLNKAIKDREDARKEIDRHEEVIKRAEVSGDHFDRMNSDMNNFGSEYSSPEIRQRVRDNYYRDMHEAQESKQALEKAWDAYHKADNEYSARSLEISRDYLERYEMAALQDIGIDDIETGMRMLEDYGLVNYAINNRNYR